MHISSLPVRECGLKSRNSGSCNLVRSSLPVRECGLKFFSPFFFFWNIVTPRAGVWIEILNIIVNYYYSVTPRAGVWIEITCIITPGIPNCVTPRAGVWIEIERL